MNVEDYLTITEAQAALGCSRRAIYRAIERAREAGHTVTETIYGRTLVPKTAIETLRRFYFPYYSPQHQAMVKKWGASGGLTKARNAEREKKKSSSSGKSGTATGGRSKA
jgi:biotin operon repressor